MTQLSKKYHPDAQGGSAAQFHQINDAYSVLGDDSKRRSYDLSLNQTSSSGSTAHYHPAYGGGGSHFGGSGYGGGPRGPSASGPHRSWGRAPPRRPPPNADSGFYNPFGRHSPGAGQSTSSSAGGSGSGPGAGSPRGAYARAAPDPFGRTDRGRRRRGATEEDEETQGESVFWRFGIVVGLLLAVVAFGGGLTASADVGGTSECEGESEAEERGDREEREDKGEAATDRLGSGEVGEVGEFAEETETELGVYDGRECEHLVVGYDRSSRGVAIVPSRGKGCVEGEEPADWDRPIEA
ncbi:hypothetical protein EHS25_001228 [Saitozyma podzolica]|uniref:J domain-containing protein n=1 Tax=Saitozyma podzolica TaxID=1890683 RepID=A0A427YHR2_9TREE|nr:hypothetical protein EHS25_001228 [Saitozyma podzolica]